MVAENYNNNVVNNNFNLYIRAGGGGPLPWEDRAPAVWDGRDYEDVERFAVRREMETQMEVEAEPEVQVEVEVGLIGGWI
jgi:hypothetical protein